MTSINDCQLIELPRIKHPSGNLTPVYTGMHVPFDITRIYYLYDIPGGETRGGHAHRGLQQLIVSAMGSFTVILDDGFSKRVITLNRAYYGLYVPTMIWRELVDFSSGAICLVLASLPYDEADYIRSYDLFLRSKQNGHSIS
jgi:WxcM-like, C-terminal